MLTMVGRFAETLEEGLRIGMDAVIRVKASEVQNVYVSGMGGSGIGADFVLSFIRDELTLPFSVGKSYDIPGWIGPQTLFIASSYSGNTEETWSALQLAIQKKARIVCVASGGKILEKARELNLDYVQLPSGWSSPRACLGFSLAAQLSILVRAGIVKEEILNTIKASAGLLRSESDQIREKASHLAAALEGKNLVIYCPDKIEPVALRFRQQINENAKRLCWHHVIPEMNHNELVGWRVPGPEIVVLFLRNSDDFNRNAFRMDLTKDLVSHFASATIELYSRGNSLPERSLYLVHLLDYVSVYLAEKNGVDPVEVKVIDFLKSELDTLIS